MKTWVLPAVCCLFLIAACAPSYKYASRRDYGTPGSKPSQRPYVVNGKRYEPLASHEGFVQRGIASWYGRDFHGKKTSSGEIYNMNAMTAAHKTLPLGVFVRVTNVRNGREAVVRINDRGPFVKGRIIDLSYAAAKTLGVDMAGTAPVRVEALGYGGRTPGRYEALADYDAGSYSVQIGSFRDYNNARRLKEEMRKIFGFSEIHRTEVRGDTYYRVYAGKYTSLKSAERAEREFAEHGYPGSFSVALE